MAREEAHLFAWERTLPACNSRHLAERSLIEIQNVFGKDAENRTLEACAPQTV